MVGQRSYLKLICCSIIGLGRLCKRAAQPLAEPDRVSIPLIADLFVQ